MKKRIPYLIILFFIFCTLNLNAQEALTNLQFNPALKNKNDITSKDKSSKAILELPFIDDFAKSISVPDPELWINDDAFINQTYAYKPLSIGVATLDAINSSGAIYSNASSDAFSADFLISKTINLNYSGDNTIFLSFYYQPGGLGDAPELKDSLLLDFYAVDSSKWYNAWYVNFNKTDSVLTEYYTYNDAFKTIQGDTIIDLKKSFQQVILPINEEQFLNGSFQFRFRNYASLSSGTDLEGTSSNSDHWHIDYVILDRNRSINDTAINDVAIREPIQSLLKTYDAVPWLHYGKIFGLDAMQDSISLSLKNLFNVKKSWACYFKMIGHMVLILFPDNKVMKSFLLQIPAIQGLSIFLLLLVMILIRHFTKYME